MLNKVMIIGRLGRDPELKYSQSGVPMCTLNIATDESYTDREGQKVDRTEWHRVVVFQRSAENCNTYLTKGSLVFIEGSLTTRKWQDQQGQDRYTTEVKAQRVQFLDKRGDSQGSGGGGDNYGGDSYGGGGSEGAPQRRPAPKPQRQQPQRNNEDMGPAFPSEAPDIDGLPF